MVPFVWMVSLAYLENYLSLFLEKVLGKISLRYCLGTPSTCAVVYVSMTQSKMQDISTLITCFPLCSLKGKDRLPVSEQYFNDTIEFISQLDYYFRQYHDYLNLIFYQFQWF
jgi:hypothetical protein